MHIVICILRSAFFWLQQLSLNVAGYAHIADSASLASRDYC